jgi:hypothetical protein
MIGAHTLGKCRVCGMPVPNKYTKKKTNSSELSRAMACIYFDDVHLNFYRDTGNQTLRNQVIEYKNFKMKEYNSGRNVVVVIASILIMLGFWLDFDPIVNMVLLLFGFLMWCSLVFVKPMYKGEVGPRFFKKISDIINQPPQNRVQIPAASNYAPQNYGAPNQNTNYAPQQTANYAAPRQTECTYCGGGLSASGVCSICGMGQN